MTTLTTSDYALMAGASYISSRGQINRFPVPSGWLGVRYDIEPSGFEAITYINGTSIGTSTDVVISFAGTGKGAAGNKRGQRRILFERQAHAVS